MRLSKIYTKSGDKGQTMLASGDMVSKDDIRIESYGTVDELNSQVAVFKDSALLLEDSQGKQQLLNQISVIQNELFDLGGELATPESVLDVTKQQVVHEIDITRLEEEIDSMNEELPALKNFVLPGGNHANSQAHVARTVCRRAERMTIRLSRQENIRPEVIKYLNRLSDWLFVASRHISRLTGTDEILWDQKKERK